MVVVAAVVAAAEVVAAVVAAVVAEADLTAHLGGRLTVNWQWRFIGLLCLPSAKPRQRQRPSAKL